MKKLALIGCGFLLAGAGFFGNRLHAQNVTFPISYETSTLDGTNGPAGIFLGNLRGRATSRDIIVANSLSNNVSILYCDDDGGFSDPVYYTTGTNPVAIRAADWNSDRVDDIAIANFGTNFVTLLISEFSGVFETTNFTIGSTLDPGAVAITIADVNRDHKLDIATANFNENTVTLLTNRTSRSFNIMTNCSVGVGPRALVVRDLDGDGAVDILTANQTDGTLTLLRGNTNNIFTNSLTITNFPGGDPQPFDLSTDDLDGDQRIDIVVANYNSNTITVLTQLANHTFQIASNYDVGAQPRSILIRDLNGDSYRDIVVANEGSNSVSVLLNLGNGTFTNGGTLATGARPMAVVGSNFNDDQQTDLAVVNYDDETISIYLNNAPHAISSRVNVLEDSSDTPATLIGKVLHSAPSSYTLVSSPTHGALGGTIPNYTYTPEPDFFGTDTLTFKCSDGAIDSGIATVTFNVIGVNDAPSFSLSTNLIVVEKCAQSRVLLNFATDITPGPTNEILQRVGFYITNDHRSYFAGPPAITSLGHLTFRPALNACGTNHVTVRLRDSGNSLFGGTNQSAPQFFDIVLPTNSFPAVTGLYNGLFFETPVAHQSSGFFIFLVRDQGAYNGKIIIDGGSYVFSGQFKADGTIEFALPRTGKSTLTVSLELDMTTDTETVTGTVTDGVWTADLNGNRIATTGDYPAPGKYTMSFVNDSDGSTSPGGDGLGLITVTSTRNVVFSGLLSDTTSIGQTVGLSRNGEWPLYAQLYGGKGSIFGWITFTNRDTSSLESSSTINWIKTNAYGIRYTSGFTNELSVIGSTISSLTNGIRALDLTNGVASYAGGDLSETLTNSINLPTNNVIRVTSTNNSLTLSLNKLNGLLTGTFRNPTTHLISPIRAILLQQTNAARGFFYSTNLTGSFLIEPE